MPGETNAQRKKLSQEMRRLPPSDLQKAEQGKHWGTVGIILIVAGLVFPTAALWPFYPFAESFGDFFLYFGVVLVSQLVALGCGIKALRLGAKGVTVDACLMVSCLIIVGSLLVFIMFYLAAQAAW